MNAAWDSQRQINVTMLPNRILAHRGLWQSKVDANSHQALQAALQAGFGIETDLRVTPRGGVVLSHDPITQNYDQLPTIEWLLEAHRCLSPASVLALNIKSDGLHGFIGDLLSHLSHDQYFLFDMSVPDLIQGLGTGLCQFARASIYEDPRPFQSITSGVWLDCFTDEFPTRQDLFQMSEQFGRLAIVSPELHGRDHSAFWGMLKSSGLLKDSSVLICTDFPRQASSFFST